MTEYRIVTHDGLVPSTDRYTTLEHAQRDADDTRDVYGRRVHAHVEQRDVGPWQPATGGGE